MGSHLLLQQVFPTQGSNLHLSPRRQICHCLNHQENSSKFCQFCFQSSCNYSSSCPTYLIAALFNNSENMLLQLKSVLPTNYLSQVRSHQVVFDISKKSLSIAIGITAAWPLSSLAGASLCTMPLINPMFWFLMFTHDSLTRAFTPLYSCFEIPLSHLSSHISRVNWNVNLWCLHFHPSFWINWLS